MCLKSRPLQGDTDAWYLVLNNNMITEMFDTADPPKAASMMKVSIVAVQTTSPMPNNEFWDDIIYDE